jgi:hypothetical protein
MQPRLIKGDMAQQKRSSWRRRQKTHHAQLPYIPLVHESIMLDELPHDDDDDDDDDDVW